MSGIGAALSVEILKARRTPMSWITVLAASIPPVVAGLFMLVLRDPVWARQNGLITTKAQLTAGSADWTTFWAFLSQAIGVGGVVLFGLIAIWVFGREWSDRTIKDLLALPTPRGAIVAAKFIVTFGWALMLTVVIVLEGLGIAMLLGLPGRTAEHGTAVFMHMLGIATLVMMLVTPFAWMASLTRGYLPAVGLLFLMVVLGQIVSALGWGHLFPWAVPALVSGVAGPDLRSLPPGSYLLVFAVGAVGIVGTLLWWRFADQM